MDRRFAYGSPSARNGRRRLFFATLLVLFLFLVDLISGGRLRGVVRALASDLWQAEHTISSAVGGSGFFSSRAALEEEVTTLQAEITQEQNDTAAQAVLVAENASLSHMTHLAQTVPGVTAPIISSLLSSPYGTFLVGAGSFDNVTSGSLALTSDGFVIGTLSDVNAHSSVVEELFATGRATDVVIDGASASAVGSGGENARASVPHGITVHVGDPVTAPEYGGRSVGVVGRVASDPASAQSQVFIALPVSISAEPFVYVTPAP